MSTSKRRGLYLENTTPEHQQRPMHSCAQEMDKVYAELLDRRDLLLINIENGERNISKEYIERHLERARPVHWRACLREAQERHGDGSAVQLAALTANPFNAELLEKGDRVFAIAALLAELQALQDLYRAV